MGKKLFKITIIMFVMLIGILGLTACESSKTDKELGYGFDNSGEPAPPVSCKFTSERSKLKVGEDLEIKLYYETLLKIAFHYPSEEHEQLPVAAYTKIFMGSSDYTQGMNNPVPLTRDLLKEVDNLENLKNPGTGLFSGSETIIIPAKIFAKEKGAIGWSVDMYTVWSENSEPENYVSGGAVLYYKIEGDNIILFDTYYKFFNDIRFSIWNFHMSKKQLKIAIIMFAMLIGILGLTAYKSLKTKKKD